MGGGQTFLFGRIGVIKINFEPYIEPNAVLDPILELDELDKRDKIDKIDKITRRTNQTRQTRQTR